MFGIKKIWRDNTMPPTNYIWMRTNVKNELIGIYEWYNGKWNEVSLNSNFYTKQEVNNLLQHVEQDTIDKLTTGIERFKQYTDDTFVTTEDVSEVDSVVRDTYTKQEIDEMFEDVMKLIKQNK